MPVQTDDATLHAYLDNNEEVFMWDIADARHVWLHCTPFP